MTTEHPITPAPELVRQWAVYRTGHESPEQLWHNVATQAARWGYQQGMDAELEACCEWLDEVGPAAIQLWGDDLRNDRRPKTPSLKEQAFQGLDYSLNGGYITPEAAATIRRALESLPD